MYRDLYLCVWVSVVIFEIYLSMYLKTLGIHVYFVTIKDSYFINGKYLEANTKIIHAIKSTLNDDCLSRVSNIESAFIVWNTLCSLGEQTPNEKESDLEDESDASNMCYMVQGDNSLEVNSESVSYTHLTLPTKRIV